MHTGFLVDIKRSSFETSLSLVGPEGQGHMHEGMNVRLTENRTPVALNHSVLSL